MGQAGNDCGGKPISKLVVMHQGVRMWMHQGVRMWLNLSGPEQGPVMGFWEDGSKHSGATIYFCAVALCDG
jgi:hypothetical protein